MVKHSGALVQHIATPLPVSTSTTHWNTSTGKNMVKHSGALVQHIATPLPVRTSTTHRNTSTGKNSMPLDCHLTANSMPLDCQWSVTQLAVKWHRIGSQVEV